MPRPTSNTLVHRALAAVAVVAAACGGDPAASEGPLAIGGDSSTADLVQDAAGATTDGAKSADTTAPPADGAADAVADAAVRPGDSSNAHDVADAAETADTADTPDTPETTGAPDTADAPETATSADTSDAADTAGTADATDTADAAAAACAIPTAAGHHTVPCGGLAFDLEIPGSCVAKPCGLIVDVHGLTMDAAMQDANTDLRALGAQHGFVVVQPNAKPAPPAASWQPGSDDTTILAFLDAAQPALAIDPKRVHFTGFSQGGWMSWRMLCKHAARFASIAPASGCSFMGTEGCAFAAGQMPPQELPVLTMHGTKDVLQPISCGKKQFDAIIQGWKLQEQAMVSQSGAHRWRRYVSPAGTVVEIIDHDYKAESFLLGGHCYPGSSDAKGGKPGQIAGFGCKGPNALHWGEAVVAFFVAHPKP